MGVPPRVVSKALSRVDRRPGGCWLWTGCTSGGYGRISWSLGNRNMVSASVHRVVYEHLRGAIPDGMDLDHTCHDPATCNPETAKDCPHRRCCNPDHLEPVDRRENLLRGGTITAHNAQVAECPQGHPYSPENTVIKQGSRRCKICEYARIRAWGQANRDRRAEANRRYRQANRDRLNAEKRAKRAGQRASDSS